MKPFRRKPGARPSEHLSRAPTRDQASIVEDPERSLRRSHPATSGRGAPAGNKNALKHGLYARHYTPQSRLDLEHMPPLESLPEIHMLRLQLDDLLTLIKDCDDEDRRIKLYNALFTGTQRLTAAMRTHTLLVGKDQQLLSTFWEALELFRQERGL